MCHEKSFIDFTQFSSALIVGKVDNNDLYSNGVGKTSIFKAIEYLLFNQADVNLEKIIRDDTQSCRIVMDFMIDNQEYRVSRTRTRKGSTDISLHQRNTVDGLETEVYHTITSGANYDTYTAILSLNEKYWIDKSSNRASDTEKELNKLIKINFKAFRSTIHFIQNDFTGLTTSTPEKRKGIFKDALNLVIYSKLEKIAKEKANTLSKQIEKDKVLLENLGNPEEDLKKLTLELGNFEDKFLLKSKELADLNDSLRQLNDKLNELNNTHSNLESKFSNLLAKEKSLLLEKSKLEISIKEYSSKKNNVIKQATDLIKEVKSLKEEQIKLAQLDFNQIDIITESITIKKDLCTKNNLTIQNLLAKLEELKIPMPSDNLCKHCRQEMSQKHKLECKKKIDEEIINCQTAIKSLKLENKTLNDELIAMQPQLNSLNLSKKQLENINMSISNKNKEVADKKAMHDDYVSLLEKFTLELKDKTLLLEEVQLEIRASSLDEANIIKSQVNEVKSQIAQLNAQIQLVNKDINHVTSGKAVVQHNIDQKNKDKTKIADLKKNILSLEKQYAVYPYVIQGFSSTGIPNLIIQNVLDDLQSKANDLLNQLKPGLQLSFSVGKTRDDGTEVDTLEINYQMNGKERYYEQLSGAMKLAVMFSLKLGLSFLLQDIIGTNIKFLMLDEIDQSLDKASVDAFAEIVKFFQKEFTVLIITHNDRLKDKISHAILVEQDINMVSRARVVSSW
jgi:DNA repair exonuclease SbcCD ATPase subunit